MNPAARVKNTAGARELAKRLKANLSNGLEDKLFLSADMDTNIASLHGLLEDMMYHTLRLLSRRGHSEAILCFGSIRHRFMLVGCLFAHELLRCRRPRAWTLPCRKRTAKREPILQAETFQSPASGKDFRFILRILCGYTPKMLTRRLTRNKPAGKD